MRTLAPIFTAALALGLTACTDGEPEDPERPPDPSGADSGPGRDSGDSGPGDSGSEGGSPLAEAGDVYGVPNLDDDDGDGGSDWYAIEPAAGDDDRSPLTIHAERLGAGEFLQLSLEGDTELIRILSGGQVLLGQDDDYVALTAGDGRLELEVEFGDFLAHGTLTATHLGSGGAIVEQATYTLLSTPLLINNHAQPTSEMVVVSYSAWGANNQGMIEDMSDVLGSRLTTVNGSSYGYDVWIQDEFEWIPVAGDGVEMEFIQDLIRDRGLDRYAEARFGAGVGVGVWGSGGATSQDYGGNIEATPPIEGYPFGRIYYGDDGGRAGPADEVIALYEAGIQAPFTIDPSWLCVAHVDEYTAFVPDSTAPRGFRLLIADVEAAREVLEGMDREQRLPRYAQDKHYDTAGEILDDQAFWDLQEDLQRDHIDPDLEIFVAELGLSEDEIVRFPTLFEQPGGCGSYEAAFVPGAINLQIADDEDGDPHVFMADPFLRNSDDTSTQDDDAMIAAYEALLPEEIELHFVDDWDVYHLALGEVHCATNAVRSQPEAWWEEALDAIEEVL